MKQTCKECGCEFELTQKEAEFYQSKGLNLPTRCKECRQVKKGAAGTKQNQSQARPAGANSSEAALLKARAARSEGARDSAEEDLGPLPGWTTKKLIVTVALLVVVLVVLFGGVYLTRTLW